MFDYSGLKYKSTRTQHYNATDFVDAIFTISEPTLSQLSNYYAQQGFRTIGDIYYGLTDNTIAVEIYRHWDRYYETGDLPEGLREYLEKQIKELMEKC